MQKLRMHGIVLQLRQREKTLQSINGVIDPAHAQLARRFRALIATYEANRDLVLMGAYRQGTDAQLDRAIAMHDRLTAFLAQAQAQIVPLQPSIAQLSELLGPES